jgi:hypothetical protein
METPKGILVIAFVMSALIIAGFVVAFYLSPTWKTPIGCLPLASIMFLWRRFLLMHRNSARWLLILTSLTSLFVLWAARKIAVSRTGSAIEGSILISATVLLVYLNLPAVRRWFIQPSSAAFFSLD